MKNCSVIAEIKPVLTLNVRSVIALVVGLSLSGCVVGPDYSSPDRPQDQNYLSSTAAPVNKAEAVRGAQLDYGRTLRQDWWRMLNSAELNRTVELALAHNGSLEAARANLAKAREGIAVARGGLFPQVDGGTSAGRTKVGATSFGPEAEDFPLFSAYGGGLAVSYDFDVFGGQQRRVELAWANAEVEQEALHASHLQVAGGTVREALRIALLRGQIKAVQSVVESDRHNLELVHGAVEAGVATQMDLTLAQSQLDRDRARLPSLSQDLAVARGALTTLVGSTESRWKAPDFDLATLQLPTALPMALPSELVQLRPDIRAAEARLQAANAEVGIATANLYPHFTLSGGIAEEGLFSGPADVAWSLIGGITGPVFHGGALSAHQRAAEDAYKATFAEYQQTVLKAFQQVAVSLHGLDHAAEEVRAEQQALDSANAALRLTREGYRVGNAGVVQIVDAQRLQQLAELQLVQARSKQYFQTVNLFLALGGGISNHLSRE